MKTIFLFPHWCKIMGLIILALAVPFWVSAVYYDGFDFLTFKVGSIGIFYDSWFGNQDFRLTIGIFFFIIGGLLTGFSREKIEDEFVQSIRLSSFAWAVLVNYVLLLLADVLIYGTNFINVLIYNMFTVLMIYILRFNFLLLKYSKKNEK